MTDDLDVLVGAACEAVLRRCKCGTVITNRMKQCRPCHAAWQRANRKKWAELSPVERKKATARSCIKMSIRRGKTVKGPCAVCGTTEKIEAHHPDHNKPLEIIWLCAAHHSEQTYKDRGFEYVPAKGPMSPEDMETFHAKLNQYIWLCLDGGMDFSEITWSIKKATVEMAIDKHTTKVNAARALGISPQALWNIQQGHHK